MDYVNGLLFVSGGFKIPPVDETMIKLFINVINIYQSIRKAMTSGMAFLNEIKREIE